MLIAEPFGMRLTPFGHGTITRESLNVYQEETPE
jgi:hypothetical protein